MATINGQRVQILVWNYHDDLVATAATPIQLTVKVPASFGSSVTVKHLRVDDTHGDAYTVWTAQGSPDAPSGAQVQALQQAMDPVALNPSQTLAVAGGSVTATFDLPRFGISLVTITPGVGSEDAGVAPVDAARGGSAAGAGGVGGGAGAGGLDANGEGVSAGGRGGQGADGSLTGNGDSGAGIGGSGGGSGSIGHASGQSGCSCETAPAGPCRNLWVPSVGLALFWLGARRRRSRRRRPTKG